MAIPSDKSALVTLPAPEMVRDNQITGAQHQTADSVSGIIGLRLGFTEEEGAEAKERGK